MKRLPLLLAVLTAMVALPGCMPSSIDVAEPEATEVTVVLSQGSYTLNPYSPVLGNRRVGHLVFSGLTRIGVNLDPEPDLLVELPTFSNGGIDKDGLTVTYRLREDARWQDGKPVTAEDVAFTLDALRRGDLTDDANVDYENIVDIRVVDSRTLVVRLKRPDAPSAWRYAPFILPAAAFEKEPDIGSAAFWTRPIGSGPYKPVSTRPAREVLLVPRSGEGPALRVVFSARAQSQREQFDGASAAIWVDGPPSTAASESLIETPSALWQVWLMNAGKGHETSDPGLRDVIAAITPVDPNVTTATTGPWGTRLPGRSILPKAGVKAKMSDAGWSRVGNTFKKDGVTVDLKIGTPTLLAENDVFVVGYRDLLNGIGLRAATSVEPAWGQGGLFDHDSSALGTYDIARTTLLIGAPYTVGWPFDSSNVPSLSRPYGSNVTRLNDPSLDRAADAVRAAGEPAEAKTRMRELGRLLDETDTVLWDGQIPARWLAKDVGGVSAHPLPEYALSSAVNWTIGTPAE